MSAISRRDAIKKAALLVGGSLLMPDILKAWGNLTIENPDFWLLPGQAELIAEIAETIVPTTGTPGAKAAGVPAFIQKIVADCYEKEDREMFFAGLEAVDAHAKAKYSHDFVACSSAERIEVLKHFEAEHHADKKAKPWWGRMKDLSVVGYFTSEIGCTQALRYEPVPGRYDGAYPYKKGDKAWA
jgi:hypothetical protein